MDRVFLDANVLYSAAYLRSSSLRRLWDLPDVELLTSRYAVEEARRNLACDRPACLPELSSLLEKMRIIDEPPGLTLHPQVRLEPKDRPILAAAALVQATHLLTGDRRHFGHLYGRRVQGVLVLVPADYLTAQWKPRRTGRPHRGLRSNCHRRRPLAGFRDPSREIVITVRGHEVARLVGARRRADLGSAARSILRAIRNAPEPDMDPGPDVSERVDAYL